MKVVLLKSRARNSGGLEKTASRIVDAFVARGAEVSILTTQGSAPTPGNGREVHAMQTSRLPSFLRIGQFDRYVQKWLRENQADIVLGMDRNRHQTHIRAGNGVHAAYLKSRILTEGHLKYATCLLNPLHQKILSLEKAAFENPHLKKVFANSHMVRGEILDRFAIDPAKVEVIHNGVEWEEMASDFLVWPEQKLIHCQSLKLDPDRLHLLFIGNGYLRKGLGKLLLAIAHLGRRDIHLSVVGKDSSQGFYETKAIHLGLGSQISFFGFQPNLRPFYQIADVLAIPSFYDPFANVTIEALAMGLFVLSSKSNGGSEVLTEQTGVIIDDLCSVESIAASLEQAVRHPKTWAGALERRESVKHLNYPNQMNILIESCLA